MNTLEERTERLQKRFDEIKAMSLADLEQYLGTIPPLVCAADIDSPIADAIKPEHITDPNNNVCPREYPPDEFYTWDALEKKGLFNAFGYAPIQYVVEQVERSVRHDGNVDPLFAVGVGARLVRLSQAV
jgi:hypothetical protein